MSILYSQCWEDTGVLLDGLDIKPDDAILSIASGGDNSFALLLKDPKSIIAIDRNPEQICLTELKIAAIKYLDYERFIQFVGAHPMKNRTSVYYELCPYLSDSTAEYWNANLHNINRGIIHIGKIETYFRYFCSYLLPMIHSQKLINNFLTLDRPEVQKYLYDTSWNNLRWRFLFRLFFSRFILSRFGRSADFFQYVANSDIAKTLLERTEYGLTALPVKNNFYAEYILTGHFRNLCSAPLYLSPNNYEIIKNRLYRLKLVCSSLEDYLKNLPAASISKFNLSDCFEYLSKKATNQLIEQILKVAQPETRIALWTLFIPQPIPEQYLGRLCLLNRLSAQLSSRAQTFFYNNFCLWQVKGG